ncbi:MAG: bifunctional DNA-formamidopyrimidine glycosylase/DNA-(apurinic or apyrimidinic site) lyase [Gemmatimonadaceae bacterium]|nr:bifunctional DNA-formamidopyrimidine glycosylase/DNA-(apurinic or apyrimidinic site) lyase [Gemmatimonadaceae bacterium]
MPELPEVETIARDLDAAVAGAVIARVRVYRGDVLRACTPRTLGARTAGATIERWWRRAKHAVADLSNGERIVISPRFTGAVLVEAAAWTRGRHDYTTLAFSLSDGRAMRYRDVRRLGTVSLLDPAAFAAWEARLGPEPLDPSFTAKAFAARIAPSRSAIKAVLMDQRRIAGIGNIYANEALWRARIGPSRAAHSLTPVERRRLHREVRKVLAEAVAQRGTSFRDYQDPHGGRGGFLASAKVYGRRGQPCARCGARLRATHAIGNRITVWCPRCQR